VVVTDGAAGRLVAGLPLAARAVLALRAAGADEVVLFGREVPEAVTRELAHRGIATRRWPGAAEAADAVEPGPPVLVLDGAVLVHGLRWPDPGGAGGPAERLAAPEGPTPAVLCDPAGLAVLLKALDGGATGLDAALAAAQLADAPARPLPAGLVRVVRGPWAGRSPEDCLLDALAVQIAGTDSYLSALIDRRLARPLSRRLLGTDLSPTQVTLAGVAVGLAGAAGLAGASYPARLAGAGLLVLSLVLDCVDGELARGRHQASRAGARLDLAGDYAVHLAVFVALAVGLARRGVSPAGLVAAVLAVAGMVASMVAVHRRFIGPALAGAGDLHHPVRPGDTPLDGLLEKVASRDYTYLLLLLALVDRLEWFVYAVAVGAWAFALTVILRTRA
jgi:phosphatidylglycerophosphate synthase